jgi:6,7-dimethyl-8-ribityllumazine synthase
LNIAIVVSEFNKEITSRMLLVAQEKAKFLNLSISHICKVSGAFDMPIIVSALLQKPEIDGVITLGTIIKGQTKHDEIIAHSTAKALTALSIRYGKPVSLGISGPGMQERHAYARIRPVAEHAVEALVQLLNELKRIQK